MPDYITVHINKRFLIVAVLVGVGIGVAHLYAEYRFEEGIKAAMAVLSSMGDTGGFRNKSLNM